MLKNVIKVSCGVLFLLSASCFAGDYSQSGYIKWVKSNYADVCWGMMSDSYGGSDAQGFRMDSCNAQEMSLLKIAQLTGQKVTLILTGDGSEYKPLRAVTLQ